MATQTLNGSCHCGAIAYTVEADPTGAVTCNCSLCSRLGDYRFNKHVLHHRFCPSCGIESYAEGKGRDGSEQAGINLRCVQSIDVNKLSPKQVDGRSR